MTSIAKGGRGREAPYKTEMYRIPTPTKPVVEQLGHLYRCSVGRPFDPDGSKLLTEVQQLLDTYPQPQQNPVEPAAIALLKEALELKANAGGAIKKKIREVLALLEKDAD